MRQFARLTETFIATAAYHHVSLHVRECYRPSSWLTICPAVPHGPVGTLRDNSPPALPSVSSAVRFPSSRRNWRAMSDLVAVVMPWMPVRGWKGVAFAIGPRNSASVCPVQLDAYASAPR